MLFGKLVITGLLALAYFQCGSADVSKPELNKVNTPATPSPAPTPISIANDLQIRLERGACFGRCPQYTVTISSDGSVEFEGKKDTKVIGKALGEIAESDLKQLVAEFEKIGYFDLKDRYTDDACPEIATDMPSATTSYQFNGKQKTVFHYFGCVTKDTREPYPPGLNLLENKIDEIAKTDQWVVKK